MQHDTIFVNQKHPIFVNQKSTKIKWLTHLYLWRAKGWSVVDSWMCVRHWGVVGRGLVAAPAWTAARWVIRVNDCVKTKCERDTESLRKTGGESRDRSPKGETWNTEREDEKFGCAECRLAASGQRARVPSGSFLSSELGFSLSPFLVLLSFFLYCFLSFFFFFFNNLVIIGFDQIMTWTQLC